MINVSVRVVTFQKSEDRGQGNPTSPFDWAFVFWGLILKSILAQAFVSGSPGFARNPSPERYWGQLTILNHVLRQMCCVLLTPQRADTGISYNCA
jgi:hypothetical protein